MGKNRLIVNCGAHANDGDAWHDVLRATASHSTVVVDDHNSSEVLGGGGLGRRASPVTVVRRDADGSVLVEASHDGYAPTRALVHRRSLYVAAGGDDIRGEDVLTGRGRSAVAVRFHLHPQVSASRSATVPPSFCARRAAPAGGSGPKAVTSRWRTASMPASQARAGAASRSSCRDRWDVAAP